MIRLLLVLLFVGNADPAEIAKINRLKAEAEEAYLNGDYNIASIKYSTLYDSLSVEEEEIVLNLAHCYYAMGDSSNARTNYQNLTTSGNSELKSIAYQQLGVMAKAPATLKQSLAYLKAALKADPTNDEARYNYEVVKKLLKEQEQQQQQNQDQQNKENEEQKEEQKKENEEQKSDQEKPGEEGEKSEDQQQQNEEQQKEGEQKDQQEGKEGEQQEEQQQQNQEGEQSDKEGEQDQLSTQQKLEEMNISEEKAQMILEAMKNNEVQYIQQQKRKATQPRDSGKPDW